MVCFRLWQLPSPLPHGTSLYLILMGRVLSTRLLGQTEDWSRWTQ